MIVAMTYTLTLIQTNSPDIAQCGKVLAVHSQYYHLTSKSIAGPQPRYPGNAILFQGQSQVIRVLTQIPALSTRSHEPYLPKRLPKIYVSQTFSTVFTNINIGNFYCILYRQYRPLVQKGLKYLGPNRQGNKVFKSTLRQRYPSQPQPRITRMPLVQRDPVGNHSDPKSAI